MGYQSLFWGAWVLSWMPRPVLGCLCPSWAAWDPFGKPGPIPGWQDPFWSAKVPSGVPGPILECQGQFGGRCFPQGVPEPISGCLALFWGSWLCFGVPGSLWHARTSSWDLFGGPWFCLGVRAPTLGHQSQFWGGRACFPGVPGPLLGCQNVFWGAWVSSRAPGSVLGCPCPLFVGPFALGVLPDPKAPGCSSGPPHFGAAGRGGQRPSLGVPAPPGGLGVSRSCPGVSGLVVLEI